MLHFFIFFHMGCFNGPSGAVDIWGRFTNPIIDEHPRGIHLVKEYPARIHDVIMILYNIV